jgi:hypothetical protein
VKVTFDPIKRFVTLQERGIDFATDAEKVFAGDTATMSASGLAMARCARSLSAG